MKYPAENFLPQLLYRTSEDYFAALIACGRRLRATVALVQIQKAKRRGHT
jgi:hypothetical protein